jgi:recombination protein RecR
VARGGMPGGFDMNALMKQAQQMQSEMLEAQEKLKDEVVEASAGGGMVKVKMSGDLNLKEITIDPDAVDPEEAEGLAAAIREVKERVGLCERCFNLAEGPLCRICSDPNRDESAICVVEEPADVIPIERTHEYRGLYHVLGGALSPIDGIDAEDLKIAELDRRVEAGGVEEVVIATNPTTTGEATALHIAGMLGGRVKVTRLASGLPVGADLEHADEVTLGKALAGRQSIG